VHNCERGSDAGRTAGTTGPLTVVSCAHQSYQPGRHRSPRSRSAGRGGHLEAPQGGSL